MTCSKDFGRLLQAACLGLIGTLAFAGCGGSEKTVDAGRDSGGGEVPQGGKAALHVSSPSVSLGTIEITTGGVGSVTLTNTGGQASGTISVVGSAGVTATGCAGTTLGPNDSCPISIVVSPTSVGVFTGTVTITANPGASPTPLTVSVTAQVVAKLLFDVTPPAIDLGNIRVGEAAPRQLITVTARVSLSDLNISASGADVTIDQAATTCTAVLAANTSCTIAVNFQAATSGQKRDSVMITGGGAAGVTVTVPITANAQKPVSLVIAPTAAQFVAEQGGASSPVGFGVANTGDVPTGALVVAITGANAASFSQTNSCLALAGLATCTISVIYRPTTATTQETATLTVTDSSGTATVSSTLTGTPTPKSDLRITSTTTDLGTVLVGTTGTAAVFTVTNIGGSNSGTIAAGVGSPDFVITNDGCSGTSLAASGTCTLSIALKPTSAGPKNGTLTVSGTAVANPAMMTITGVGITGPNIVVSPASLDFPNVRVNMMGTEQTVTVSNTGGTATGAIIFNRAGDFDVFPITSNGCSAPLPPAVGTCTFAVNFAPKAEKAYSASFTITDGATSATLSVSGTGLRQTGLSITPSPVGACAEPELAPALDKRAYAMTNCFPATVVGGSRRPIRFDAGADPIPGYNDYGSVITFEVRADNELPAGVADTGAIAIAINPATPADFVIVTNGCATPLLAGASCQVTVSFTPTAVGLRQATLAVTSANGGYDNVTMQGIGLSLLEIRPLNTVDENDDPITGLHFGQVSVLGDQTSVHHDYLVIVRGPNSATASTSSVLTTLTDPSQPADFMYYPLGTNVNPCNSSSNQAVTLSFSDPETSTGIQNGNWQFVEGPDVWVCGFSVRFYPQSTQGEKSATLSATGSGSASDTKTLTGVATGPLTFEPDPVTFDSLQVGGSTNAQAGTSIISLSGEDKVITLTNHSTTTDYGPVSLTLGGANADQFLIVGDYCSTVTLTHNAGANNPCYVTVAFVPTSAGAKTALLTANAGGETAQVVINGGATDPFDITITPDQYVEANNNVHDFGTVAQLNNQTWVAFTITNPAGSLRSAQVTFGLDKASSAYNLANGNNHVFGSCGNTGTTSLEPGQSCTFWVQFMPTLSHVPSSTTELIGWIFARDEAKGKTVYVKGSGKVGGIITMSPATHTFPDTPSGETSAALTLTVTNNSSTGASPVSLGIPLNDAALSPFLVNQTAGCAAAPRQLAAGATCQLFVTFEGKAGITAKDTVTDRKLTVTANTDDAEATTLLTGSTVLPAKLVAVGYANNGDSGWSAFYQTINLGGVQIGKFSGSVTLTFKNVGSVATGSLQYKMGDAADNQQDGEFLINTEDPDRCVGRSSLAAGATCTVTVNFRPSSTGGVGARGPKNFALSALPGSVVQVFKFQGYALDAQTGNAWIGIQGGANAFYAFPNMTPPTYTTFPTQTFRITNPTASSLSPALVVSNSNFTLLTLAADGQAAGDTPCGAVSSLAPQAYCTFGVGFTPSANWTATTAYRHATVTATAFGSGTNLGVYGRVQSPAILSITPVPSGDVDPYDFGQVVISGSPTKAFTVTNMGESASGVLTLQRNADLETEFSFSGGCSAASLTLSAGASCVGNVVLTAGTTPVSIGGHFNAVDNKIGSGVVGQTQASNEVLVSADIVFASVLSVSPSSLTFPAQAVGTVSSTTQTVTVTNLTLAQTSGLLTISLADSTNFSIVSTGDCPVYTDSDYEEGLAAGISCEVEVAFKPQTLGTGTFTTNLEVKGSPGGTKTVAITGTAVSAMHFTPASPSPITNTVSSPYVLTVSLDLGAPTTGYIVTTLTGTGYVVVEDQCVATKMSGGDSCKIKVAFTGASATPYQTATLKVDGGTAGNTASVVLNSTTPP